MSEKAKKNLQDTMPELPGEEQYSQVQELYLFSPAENF